MILLSRLIKSQHSNTVAADKKVISIRLLESSVQNEGQPVFTQTEEERTRILSQAAKEAEGILSKASEEAEYARRLIFQEKEEWERQKALLAEEAKQIGFDQGYQEGKSRGYEEYRELLRFAQETVDVSKRDYQNHIEASEKVILDLGVKIAEKILGDKVTADEGFFSLVKRALKNARDYKDIQLHVHPGHYQFLLSQKEELIAIFPKEIDFYIYPDDDLPETACLIESENGRIDATVDSQLEEIKQKLFEMLESE
ncbi:flagellar assembly protein FliH [Mesobacillus subterraneus]|uniref:Flagellar assembly protein FliH n=1 Tax=Mesobacillus subterraneus TaxID=285983 RepID=A0A3R9FYG4_9BACI|nr:flagellar assembly protein FliH [Mesobacillus subterraneus]RSD28025.1 flagellar assembly protein FliH [Mesobacillus subterraneus]